MPAPPAFLCEGISEADFKGQCDSLKPLVDKALGAQHLQHSLEWACLWYPAFAPAHESSINIFNSRGEVV